MTTDQFYTLYCCAVTSLLSMCFAFACMAAMIGANRDVVKIKKRLKRLARKEEEAAVIVGGPISKWVRTDPSTKPIAPPSPPQPHPGKSE